MVNPLKVMKWFLNHSSIYLSRLNWQVSGLNIRLSARDNLNKCCRYLYNIIQSRIIYKEHVLKER